MKSKFLFIAAFVILVAPFANAALTVVYSTNFKGPLYSDGALNSNTNTTTVGQDGWLNTSGGGTNNISVSNAATTGTVFLTTSGQDVRRPFATVAGTGGSSVFLQANITVGSAQATGDYFLSLGDGTTTIFNARTYIKSTTGGFLMALGTGSGAATYGTGVLLLNTPYSILVRYDFVTGPANDTGALFVDPISEEGIGDTPYVTATTVGIDSVSVGAVYLRQGNATNAAGVTIDSLTVSIPEPSAMVISAFGMLGILRRRR